MPQNPRRLSWLQFRPSRVRLAETSYAPGHDLPHAEATARFTLRRRYECAPELGAPGRPRSIRHEKGHQVGDLAFCQAMQQSVGHDGNLGTVDLFDVLTIKHLATF